jgi:hypothetical protein
MGLYPCPHASAKADVYSAARYRHGRQFFFEEEMTPRDNNSSETSEVRNSTDETKKLSENIAVWQPMVHADPKLLTKWIGPICVDKIKHRCHKGGTVVLFKLALPNPVGSWTCECDGGSETVARSRIIAVSVTAIRGFRWLWR